MARKKLYLYRLSQTEQSGWDTFDSFIVAGYSEDDVRGLQPDCDHDIIAKTLSEGSPYHRERPNFYYWTLDPSKVEVERVGVAETGIEPGQIICSSFNAG